MCCGLVFSCAVCKPFYSLAKTLRKHCSTDSVQICTVSMMIKIITSSYNSEQVQRNNKRVIHKISHFLNCCSTVPTYESLREDRYTKRKYTTVCSLASQTDFSHAHALAGKYGYKIRLVHETGGKKLAVDSN